MASSNNFRVVTASSRKPSPKDWEDIKAEVFRVYITEGKTLSFAMDWFKLHHQLDACERTWKNKVDEWGFIKHFKSHEMNFMVRKREKRLREGKETDFFRGGVQVSTERLDNFKRRREGEKYPEVATPSNIVYNTPRPDNEEDSTQDEDDILPLPLSQLNLETTPELSMFEQWLIDGPSTASERLLCGRFDQYNRIRARNDQVYERIERCLARAPFLDANDRQVGRLYAPALPLPSYIVDWSSLDPQSAVNQQAQDMTSELASFKDKITMPAAKLAQYKEKYGEMAPQTLKQEYELARVLEADNLLDAAEYHCRRILNEQTQIHVQCLLGTILANTSRLQASVFYLSVALTCFIAQFATCSIGENIKAWGPIKLLVNKLIREHDEVDFASFSNCIRQMAGSLHRAESNDTLDQISTQLFIHGFRFAHECSALNFTNSAEYVYDILLERSSSHLDAVTDRIEQTKAHQRYGLLLRRLGRWASSAKQLLLAGKSVMKLGTCDELAEVLKLNCSELVPHLALGVDEERALAEKLEKLSTKIEQQYRPSFLRPIQEYLQSSDSPRAFFTPDTSAAQQAPEFRLTSLLPGSRSDQKGTSTSGFSSNSSCSKGLTYPSGGMTGVSLSELMVL